MGTNEYSQPASKSSWDGQDLGDVKMEVKMAHFHKSSRPQWVNTLRSRQNGCHFGDNIFKLIFLYESCCILNQISVKFVVSWDPFKNNPALVPLMACCKTGNKPLLGPMMA